MALLERVSTLIRANLNELIDKAEHPEIMIKQVILDMENQLLQVKTQVAIAMADQHLLERKQKENEDKIADWGRKAEMAVGKKQDDLARAAIERSLHYKQMSENFRQQVADQAAQVETLKNALNKLTQKLEEATDLVTAIIKTQYFGKTGLRPVVETNEGQRRLPGKVRVSVGYGDLFTTTGNSTPLCVDFGEANVALQGDNLSRTFGYDQLHDLYQALTDECRKQTKYALFCPRNA